MATSKLSRIANKIAAVPSREGALGAPEGQVIAHLQLFLTAKYAIDMAYRSFADRVRGPWRDALVDHWHDHSKEERGHSYDLAMKIVGLGGDPIQTVIQIPACTASLAALMQVLMDMELDVIEAGRALCSMAGDNTSLRVMGENMIIIDTQHLDDLRRMAAKFDTR